MHKFIICIGVPRTATSFLYQLFRDCTDCSYAKIKETNYFLDLKGTKKSYEKLFERRSEVFFECSPAYFSSMESLIKIKHELVNPEIIFCSRNIKERFISQYKHHYEIINKKYPNFNEYCADAFVNSNDWFHPNYNLRCSNYKKILSDLLEVFPIDKVHHLSQDELKNNPDKWVSRVENISQVKFKKWKQKNKTNHTKPTKEIFEFTEELNKELESYESDFHNYTY